MLIKEKFNITANRRQRKWSNRELVGRALWSLVWPIFRFSPRPLWGWRRVLLRLFGAQVGQHVHIHPTARISVPWNISIGNFSSIGDCVNLYSLGSIKIGERVTVSQGAHLCAGSHDWRDPLMSLLKLPISVGSDSWICADAFVGPNVSVGEHCIVAARCVVMKNVASQKIVAGNPARVVGGTVS